MPYLNTSYFIGDIFLPFNNSEFREVFNENLDNIEQEILLSIFGYDFRKQLNEGIISQEQKWLDILNGKEYQQTDLTYNKFNGLYTLLKYFVYFRFVQIISTQMTTIGEVSSIVDNSMLTTNQNKMRLAFNRGIDELKELEKLVNYQNSLVPESYTNFSVSTYYREINLLWI